MSDYVGNLVGRAMGTMPTVQPRVASRFEGAPVVESSQTVETAARVAGLTAPYAPETRTVEIRERVEPGPEIRADVVRTRTSEERQLIVERHQQTSEIRTEIRQSPPAIIPPPAAPKYEEEGPALLVPSWQPPPQVALNFPRPEPHRTQSAAAEAAQPVVRVHINRIEVRAPQQVTDKPAKPEPVPSQKPMSLDTYLRSRQGGSR